MGTAFEVEEPKVREPEVQQKAGVRQPASVPFVLPPLTGRPLFSDSLLELEEPERRRRKWATVISLISQCFLLGILLIVPLMYTDVLPRQQLLTFLVAPPPPPPPPPPAAESIAKVVRQVQTDLLSGGQLRTPSRIPEKVQMLREEEAPPPVSATGGVIGGVPGGIPGGQLGGVIGGIISSSANVSMLPKLAAPTPKRVRVSQGVTRGLLIQKVEPPYPTLARQARIQGQVVLSAIISKEGEIENLTLVSGHPLLAPAAIEAVRKWRYRPFLLNGVPVEVETTINVNFQLAE
jgi:protein TonB